MKCTAELEKLRKENEELRNKVENLENENKSLKEENIELMQQKADIEKKFIENVNQSNEFMEQMKRELEGIREVMRNRLIS